MKTLCLGISIASVLASGAWAEESKRPLPEKIAAPIEKIYVPTGFDDNDNVEIVLKGTFANNCYRTGESNAVVNKETKEISIQASSYFYSSQPFCLEVLTNFLQPVKVGILEAGDYTVKFNGDTDMQTNFTVGKRKTEAADDYLYANVENAYIKVDYNTGKQSLVIKGHHPHWFNGCQVITEVRTYRDPVDVIVVLPITEIRQGPACEAQTEDRAFERMVPVDSPFESEGMIHVRTLNGNSINQYIAPLF